MKIPTKGTILTDKMYTPALCAIPVLAFSLVASNMYTEMKSNTIKETKTVKTIKQFPQSPLYINLNENDSKTALEQITKNNEAKSAIEAYLTSEEEKASLIKAQEEYEQYTTQKQTTKLANENINTVVASIGVNDNSSYTGTTVNQLIDKYCSLYKFERPDIVRAIIMVESGGNQYSSNGHAAGYMQIENTLAQSFSNFGKEHFGETWTLDDRFDAEKNIAFGIYQLHILDMHYNGDMDKVIQAYNFSHYSLDKLIQAFGDNWINHRSEIAFYNGVYKRTGSTRYGNPNYLEKVKSYM